MSDDEKKAIERCNQLIKIENANWMGISNQSAIATALDLIEKQQNRIKEREMTLARYTAQTVNADIKQMHKHNEDLEMLYKGCQIELEKKDKIIDEMANHIATSDSNLCQYLDMTTKCKYYAGENKKTCDKCIKEYFTKKVEVKDE